MKKATLNAIAKVLNGEEIDNLEEVKAEVAAEMAKGQAKADATKAEYADLYEQVMEVLEGATAPVTAQEIADEVGVARGKIVYGLTNYWKDKVVKDTTGKATTYAKA
jgi:GTP-sensing pleiotropic transcriptional regulator CodY